MEKGTYLDIANHLLNMSGLDFDLTDKSSAVQSYSDCVNDIAQDNTDMCIGSFWATSGRQALTPFLVPIKHINIAIITKRMDDDQRGIFDVFSHVSQDVWLTIIGSQVVLAIFQMLFENRQNKHELGSENLFSNFVNIIANSTIGLFSGRSKHTPSTISGKMVVFSVSIIQFFFQALFIASIVSFFMIYQVKTDCNSLKCFQEQKKIFTVMSPILDDFNLVYPEQNLQGFVNNSQNYENFSKATTLPKNLWTKEKYLSIFGLLNNLSHAILLPFDDILSLELTLDDFEQLLIEDGLTADQCDQLQVTYLKTSLEIYVGLPVSTTLHSQLNQHFGKMEQETILQQFLDIQRSEYQQMALNKKGIGMCESPLYKMENYSLNPNLQYGVWFVASTIFGVALLCQAVNNFWTHFLEENQNKNLKQTKAMVSRCIQGRKRRYRNSNSENNQEDQNSNFKSSSFNQGFYIKNKIRIAISSKNLSENDKQEQLDESQFKSTSEELEQLTQ